MNRRCFSLLFFIFISSTLFSQQNSKTNASLVNYSSKVRDAFKAGEWFKFKVYYGIFNACYATLELNEEEYNGYKTFHAKGVGRTSGLTRFFFKIDDYYDSYFLSDVIKPVHFIRNISEGNYKKHITIDFSDNIASVTNIIKGTQNKFKVNPNAQDLMSCFYFLRNHFDIDKMTVGDTATVDMFFDDSNYEFEFKYLGKEKIKTKFGNVMALKFRPFVVSGRVFRSSESITLWISSDENKIPLKLKANLRVGSITVELDEFKGLKNPFDIVIN